MNGIAFATVDDQGSQRVAAVEGDQAYLLPPAITMRGLLADWERCLEQQREAVARGRLGEPLPLSGLRLLAPVPDPPNLFMAGANYLDHLAEMGNTNPLGRDRPLLFLKSPSSLVDDGADIHPPAQSRKVDWEAELAAVITAGSPPTRSSTTSLPGTSGGGRAPGRR